MFSFSGIWDHLWEKLCDVSKTTEQTVSGKEGTVIWKWQYPSYEPLEKKSWVLWEPLGALHPLSASTSPDLIKCPIHKGALKSSQKRVLQKQTKKNLHMIFKPFWINIAIFYLHFQGALWRTPRRIYYKMTKILILLCKVWAINPEERLEKYRWRC